MLPVCAAPVHAWRNGAPADINRMYGTSIVGSIAPAAPLQPVIDFLITYPLVIPLLLLIFTFGPGYAWGKAIERRRERQQPLVEWGEFRRRTYRLMFVEDDWPALKPQTLAQKYPNITWVRLNKIWVLLTLWWLIIPPTNFIPHPDATVWWLYGLAPIALWWIISAKHVQYVVRNRHHRLMQMFDVAAAEFRHQGGAELNPWGYVIVSEWHDLYNPGETTLMYEARFRSEDPRNRQAFETNFAGTVSDQHTWTYKWESANNRVIATPVPFIVEQAPYPFPDTYPWYEIPVGLTSGGEVATIRLDQFPHTLLAGTTGSGKSVTQRTILMHCLASPEWRVVLVDPKRVELSVYKDARNVLQVATELEESVDLIANVEQEMYARYDKMQEEGVNHFADLATPPPALLVMIDEVFALLSPENVKSEEGKERDEMHARATTLIGSVARLGRAAGVHLVLATQRPDAKVLPGETRANLDVRIAQGRMDTTPSLMTLDSDHATRLPPVKGRAVLRTGNDYREFQAFFLPPEDLPKVLEMSDALAGKVITPDDLAAPTADDTDNGERSIKATLAKVRQKLPRVSLPAMPRGLKAWVAKRQAVVERNEALSGRTVEGTPLPPVPQPHHAPAREPITDSRSASHDEVAPQPPEATLTAEDRQRAREAREHTAHAPRDAFARVRVPDPDDIEIEYGVLVADVLRDSAERGVPLSAADLIAALKAEIIIAQTDKNHPALTRPEPSVEERPPHPAEVAAPARPEPSAEERPPHPADVAAPARPRRPRRKRQQPPQRMP